MLCDCEALDGIDGEVLPVGADFATIPLQDGEIIVGAIGDLTLDAYVISRKGEVMDAIAEGPQNVGSVVSVRLEMQTDAMHLYIWAPTSAGNYYGVRRPLNVIRGRVSA